MRGHFAVAKVEPKRQSLAEFRVSAKTTSLMWARKSPLTTFIAGPVCGRATGTSGR